MATKYSGSLDVGAELDDEKRKPVIDDSEDGEETASSQDDDFNELIRKELGEPEKPRKEIMIEPAAEVPKVEPKPEVKEIKIEKKVEPKVEKAPEPKIEKKVVAPKIEKKPAKVEKKPVAPAPKVEKPKVEKPKVEKREPKIETRKPAGGNRIITILILLLVAAGAVYAVSALRSTKDSAAMGCASQYVDDRGGISLAWGDASSVEQYWLKQAYEATSETEAARIFHMLACPEAFLSPFSDPNGYVNCKTPSVYVIVDSQALKDNPVASLDSSSVLSKLASQKNSTTFSLKYALSEPSVSAWEVRFNATKKA
jgi:hypothetical protein